MTRAKQNLYIHSNWSYWNHVNMEIAEKIVNSNDYGEPDELCLHLGHTDVWLGYFIYKQQYIDGLTSGDELVFEGDTCFTRQKQPVLKFSKDFWKKLKILQQKGYMFKTIRSILSCIGDVMRIKKSRLYFQNLSWRNFLSKGEDCIIVKPTMNTFDHWLLVMSEIFVILSSQPFIAINGEWVAMIN